MSYEQFWYGDAESYWAYRTAFLKARELDMQEANHKAWLYGMYNYKAFSVVEYNVNKEKGREPDSYFEEPMDIFGYKSEKTIALEKKTKLENQMKAYLTNKSILLDRKKKKGNK
jgi:hypothetical protein